MRVQVSRNKCCDDTTRFRLLSPGGAGVLGVDQCVRSRSQVAAVRIRTAHDKREEVGDFHLHDNGGANVGLGESEDWIPRSAR